MEVNSLRDPLRLIFLQLGLSSKPWFAARGADCDILPLTCGPQTVVYGVLYLITLASIFGDDEATLWLWKTSRVSRGSNTANEQPVVAWYKLCSTFSNMFIGGCTAATSRSRRRCSVPGTSKGTARVCIAGGVGTRTGKGIAHYVQGLRRRTVAGTMQRRL